MSTPYVSVPVVPAQPPKAVYLITALETVPTTDFVPYSDLTGAPPPFDITWPNQLWADTTADVTKDYTYPMVRFDAQGFAFMGTNTIPGARAAKVNIPPPAIGTNPPPGAGRDLLGNQVPIPIRTLLPNERFSKTYGAFGDYIVRTDMISPSPLL